MHDQNFTITGLGELLWDLLPAGKQLGGAPANFAYIANLLGDRGIPASRVGCDPMGDEALRRLAELGVRNEFVQRDPIHPTGTVDVAVENGQPQFDIAEGVAWDFLEWSASWQQLANKADAVCFGSLAQRSPTSRATIRSFIHSLRPDAERIFDVNLRQSFYNAEILKESMGLATVVKLNHQELRSIMRMFELDHRAEEDSARRLLTAYDLKLICVTRGSNGSLLISREESSEHPGFRVRIADTVGAGDAFTAAMLHGYLRRQSLAEINHFANQVGAWVASRPGATPTLTPGDLERISPEE